MDVLGGVMLLGTPHRGSPAHKWGAIISQLASLMELGERGLMDEVAEDSIKIFNMVHDFMQVIHRIGLVAADAVVCFYENSATNYLQRYVSMGVRRDRSVSSMVRMTCNLTHLFN